MLLGEEQVFAILPATDLERARRFWTGLGARETEYDEPTHEVMFEAGDGTAFVVYERGEPTKAEHTVMGFHVGDLDAAMRDLRGRGVRFEEYDLPYLKTEGGIASMGETRGAWFKDSEGNIVALTEHARRRMPTTAGRSRSGDIGM